MMSEPQLRRLRRASRGLTLVEVLIASSIGALLVLLASTLLTKPTAMIDEVGQQMQERSLLDIRNRELVRRFNRTFVMRRGFFQCSDSPLGNVLGDSAAFSGRSVSHPDAFTLAYSEYSTVVGLDDASSRRLSLAGTGEGVDGELNHVSAGALVLLTSLSHPNFGGVFRVEAADPDNMTIRLASTSVSLPADFKNGGTDRCSISNSTTFENFIASEYNRIFGEQARSYRIDVIRLVHYYPVASLNGQTRDLMQKTWPVAPPGATAFDSSADDGLIQATVAVPGYAGIAVEQASWRPTGGAGGTNGEFAAMLDIQTTEKRGVASVKDGQARLNILTKHLRRPLGYSTSTGGQVNFGAITIPPTAERTYPTCAVALTPMPDMIQRDDGQFGRFYRLSGTIADAAVVAGISVQMSAAGGLSPICWSLDDLIPGTDGMTAPVAQGRTTVVPLNPMASGALEELVCDAPPSSTFNPTLSYFHSTLSKVVVVGCSRAETPPAGATAFVYDGSPSTCERATGVIRFGRLVESNTNPPRSGPTLFVDGSSCEWSAVPAFFQSCSPNPTKGELLKVRLKPSNLPGGIPGAGGPNRNEIDCT